MMRRRSEGRAAPAGAQAQVARHGRANEAYVCMGRREGGREGGEDCCTGIVPEGGWVDAGVGDIYKEGRERERRI